MAIDKDLKSIFTNLPMRQLELVIKALENKRVEWKPETGGMMCELFREDFVFDEATYNLVEVLELVNAIELKSGNPVFVQALIDEHEVDLTEAVTKRDYDLAKKINSKIESLKKSLPQ